jgi:hypothetical protein
MNMSYLNRKTFAIVRGKYSVIQSAAELHLARAADYRVNPNAGLRSYTHPRRNNAELVHRMRGLLAFKHSTHGCQRARPRQFTSVNLNAEPVGHVIK